MLNITVPITGRHWLHIVKMHANNLQAHVPGMVVRDFRVTVPNNYANDTAAAQRDLAEQLQRLTDRLNEGQPVRVLGAMIPAPEGAAAVLRVLAMPDAEGHFPDAVHTDVFSLFTTTVTALDNSARYAATHLIDIAAGTDLQEGAA